MNAVRSLVALSAATLLSACAGHGGMMARAPAHDMGAMQMPPAAARGATDPRMKSMQEMHAKMAKAATLAEREALMADHMKAMQGGMAMMKEMHAMHTGTATGTSAGTGMAGGSGMPGMEGSKGSGQGMAAETPARHSMMADHMAMMQMMMEMMAHRLPPAAPGK